MDLGQLEYDVVAHTGDLDRAEQRMDDFTESARKGEESIEKFGRSTKTAGDKTKRGMRQVERSSKRATDQIGRLNNVVNLLAGSLVAREIIRYADAWNNAANQLRQVTDSSEELSSAQNRLLRVANETRSGFSATANLYARLSRATTELGVSGSDLLSITRTINQSFAVSGATAEEASAAITQLSQGLAAGALRGDEFNSVAEQAPGIMRAIAESLDMGIGELRDFAAEGGITAEIVVNALQEASNTIDREFGKSVATFGQNMEVARNNLMEWVGTSSEVDSAVSALGTSILTLSENLDTIVSIGKVVATLYAGRLVRAMQSYAAKALVANGATLTLTGSMRALRTVMATAFGPAGLVLAGVVALGEIGSAFDDTQRDAEDFASSVDKASESLQGFTEQSLITQIAAISVEMERAKSAAQELDDLNRQAISGGGILGGMGTSGVREQASAIAATGGRSSDRVRALDAQLQGLQNALEMVRESGGKASDAISETNDSAEEAKEATEEVDKLAQSYQSILDRIRPLQASQRQYAEEKGTLVEFALRENMAAEELVSLLEDLERSYQSTRTVAEAYGESGVKANEDIAKAADDIGFAFKSAFEEAIIEGNGFRDVLQGILDDILKIALRTAVTEPLGQAIGGFASGLFGGGQIEGGFTTQVGTGASFAGAFDSGGSIGSGQFGLVGERGPELVSGPAHVTGREDTARMMGGGDVEVNVYAPEGSDVRTEERQTPGGRSIDVIIDEKVAQNISNPGSRTGRALKNTFGSQRILTGRG